MPVAKSQFTIFLDKNRQKITHTYNAVFKTFIEKLIFIQLKKLSDILLLLNSIIWLSNIILVSLFKKKHCLLLTVVSHKYTIGRPNNWLKLYRSRLARYTQLFYRVSTCTIPYCLTLNAHFTYSNSAATFCFKIVIVFHFGNDIHLDWNEHPSFQRYNTRAMCMPCSAFF